MKIIYQLSCAILEHLIVFSSVASEKVRFILGHLKQALCNLTRHPYSRSKALDWLPLQRVPSILHSCQRQHFFKISIEMWASPCSSDWNQTLTTLEFLELLTIGKATTIRACRGHTLGRFPGVAPSPHTLCQARSGLLSKPLRSRQILPLLSTIETESSNTDGNFSIAFSNCQCESPFF